MQYIGVVDNSRDKYLEGVIQRTRQVVGEELGVKRFDNLEQAVRASKSIMALFVRTHNHADIEAIEKAKQNSYRQKTVFAVVDTKKYLPKNSFAGDKTGVRTLFREGGELQRLKSARAIILHRCTTEGTIEMVLDKYVK